jgi:hypothetical protein
MEYCSPVEFNQSVNPLSASLSLPLFLSVLFHLLCQLIQWRRISWVKFLLTLGPTLRSQPTAPFFHLLVEISLPISLFIQISLSLTLTHSLTHSLSLSGFWLATTPTTKSRGHTSPPHVLNMLLVSPLTSPSLPSLSVWSYGFLPRNPSYIPNKSSRDVDAKMSKILRLLSFISIVIKWLVQSILRH